MGVSGPRLIMTHGMHSHTLTGSCYTLHTVGSSPALSPTPQGARLLRTAYKSKCWFHLGSRVDLMMSVEWHCPLPSTTILAKGSGNSGRKKSHSTVFCSSY